MTLPTLKMAVGVTPVCQKSRRRTMCITRKHTDRNRAMVLAELMFSKSSMPLLTSHSIRTLPTIVSLTYIGNKA
jgi:hypothetical protein